MTEKQIAKQVGVTPAGLRFLASLHATGQASQRGNEAAPLHAAGLIEPKDGGSREWWAITDQGRETVQRARSLGW